MGMDVYGKSGNYFRANIFSWPGILNLTREAAPNIITDELYRDMQFNDGAGLDGEDACNDVADLIENFMSQKPRDWQLVHGREPEEGHVKEWVTFLRQCEGFEVL